MGNLSTVLAVMHEQHLKLLRVVDEKLVESIRKQVSGLLIRTISDGWLRNGALEASANSRINTLLLPP